METKIIKVKTNGDIQRDAHVVSGFEIDGSEYVLYYIDRDDGINDNIFTSKLLKNTDNTYNMLDLEDSSEKQRIVDQVKNMVRAAVDDNEHDTIDATSITLTNGKVVKLFPVIINVEQKVDVNKSYITSVKKSVTEVTRKYYDIKPAAPAVDTMTNESIPVISSPIELAKDETIMNKVVSTPAAELTMPTIEVTEPEVETAMPSIDEAAMQVVPELFSAPQVEPISVEEPVQPEPVVSVIPDPVPVVEAPAPTESVVPTEIPVITPIETSAEAVAPAEEPVMAPVVEPVVAPVLPAESPVQINDAIPNLLEPTPAVEPINVIPTQASPVENIPNLLEPTPVVNELPAAEIKPVEMSSIEGNNSNDFIRPIDTAAAINIVTEPSKAPVENNTLVLDASNETNLNNALGEASETIPVTNIEAIKEFGLEDNTPVQDAQGIKPMVQPEVNSDPVILTKKAGFANSKFFIFVALAFFLASCIFLGYEAFNYFQLVK